MLVRPILLTLPIALLACRATMPVQDLHQLAQREDLPEFNRIVLDIASEYPTDGTHDYFWPRGEGPAYDGCTTDVFLQGEKVMDGEPEQRTYCCGLTLEVFTRAYDRWLEAHPDAAPRVSAETWRDFQHQWFVPEMWGSGPSAALDANGLGRTITPEEALPGDFVQLWRVNEKGHSVIFLDWVRDDGGEITGILYWSTQKGTQGISPRVELFDSHDPEEGVIPEYTHWGRAEPSANGG